MILFARLFASSFFAIVSFCLAGFILFGTESILMGFIALASGSVMANYAKTYLKNRKFVPPKRRTKKVAPPPQVMIRPIPVVAQTIRAPRRAAQGGDFLGQLPPALMELMMRGFDEAEGAKRPSVRTEEAKNESSS